MSVYTVHACFLACIETSFLFSQTRIYWPIGAWPGPPTFSTSDTEASQSGIKPGISCTAGEHSMQRAIHCLYYYSSPPSRDVASSWLGIVAEFDSYADIIDQTRGGSNALKPLLRAREQGARTSEPRENCIMLGSPLCRGLSRESNTLCKEPIERHC
jgi:hypothetical protein